MNTQWTITLRSEPIVVGGFANVNLARQHGAKHYLNETERWEQVDAGARDVRKEGQLVEQEHGRVSPPYFKFLEAASVRYVIGVRSESETAVRVERLKRVDERNMEVSRIAAVTKNGVFAVFSGVPRNGVSDLRTALRRYVRAIKNPQPSDFLNSAHALLRAQLQGARFLDD